MKPPGERFLPLTETRPWVKITKSPAVILCGAVILRRAVRRSRLNPQLPLSAMLSKFHGKQCVTTVFSFAPENDRKNRLRINIINGHFRNLVYSELATANRLCAHINPVNQSALRYQPGRYLVDI